MCTSVRTLRMLGLWRTELWPQKHANISQKYIDHHHHLQILVLLKLFDSKVQIRRSPSIFLWSTASSRIFRCILIKLFSKLAFIHYFHAKEKNSFDIHLLCLGFYIYLVLGSELLTAVIVRSTNIWDVTPCSPVEVQLARSLAFLISGFSISGNWVA
jgi:hypothetical protein